MIVLLATALLHFLWQGLLLGAAYWAVRPWLRSRSASVRYGIEFAWLLTAPVIVLGTMAWLVAGSSGFSGPVAAVDNWLPPWALVVTGAWAAGASIFAVRTGLGFWRLLALRATGLPLRELAEPVDRLRERLGVRRRVVVVESPAVETPMVTGVVRPMILLPLGLATRMPVAWVESLLAHELAHVRRHDVLLGIVQRVVEILLFFHPVVWWISAELRQTREQACDDLVVDALHAPLDYARALAELAATPQPVPALAMAARQGQLMSRIRHIVSREPRPLSRPPRLAPLAGGLVLGITVAVGCIARYDSAPKEEAGTEAPEAEVNAEPAEVAAAANAEEAQPSELSIAWLPESVRRFEAEIVEAGNRYGVEPDLVAILVLLESNGNPTARSFSGARGLMQVTPSTAVGIARERGLAEPTADELDDPAYNLDMGTWFFARQLKNFGEGGGDEAIGRAAAAYNGGPTRLRATLRGEAELSEETQRYRANVEALWAARDEAELPPRR